LWKAPRYRWVCCTFSMLSAGGSERVNLRISAFSISRCKLSGAVFQYFA
jgi:hypothetical protein